MTYALPMLLRDRRPADLSAASAYVEPARILVADDDEDVRDLVAMTLRMAGYSVAVAVDGQDALMMIEEDTPTLAVLDVMMPGTSGFAICRRLRERPATAALPVILITAKQGDDAAIAGFGAGANRYLTKPIDFRRLLADVKSLL